MSILMYNSIILPITQESRKETFDSSNNLLKRCAISRNEYFILYL